MQKHQSIHYQLLRSGERLSSSAPSSTGLRLIVAHGRSIAATLRTDHSLWVPLRGELRIETSDGTVRLHRRQVLHWNNDELQASTASGFWLCLHGSTAEWKQSMQGLASPSEHRKPLLYPCLDNRGQQLTRDMVGLAKGLLRDKNAEDGIRCAFRSVLLSLFESQAIIDRMSGRCSGHSLSRRRHNLLRLIRVRNRIQMNPASRFDLGTLAASANYSQWHFIRTFKQVFDETPCDYAGRVRMEHARKLIAKTPMSISEIAETIGYDSRSAFCRSFRSAFGVSPSSIRNRVVRPKDEILGRPLAV